MLGKQNDRPRNDMKNNFGRDKKFFNPAYMGPSGWLGLDFTAKKKVDWDEVRELVDASFRMIAPKKLIKELDARPPS